MTRHARIPAMIAIALSATLGLGILAGTGQFRAKEAAGASLEELEKRIVGSRDGAVWEAYGDKLRASGRFASAAKAYERALEFQPDLTGARLQRAIALSEARDADGFFTYFARLSVQYPKLAADLLERAELAPIRTDDRWAPAAASARAQAID
jgi:tetratricopeptide (TPR) repeat protein